MRRQRLIECLITPDCGPRDKKTNLPVPLKGDPEVRVATSGENYTILSVYVHRGVIWIDIEPKKKKDKHCKKCGAGRCACCTSDEMCLHSKCPGGPCQQ